MALPVDRTKILLALVVYLGVAVLARVFAVENAAWIVGADMSAYIQHALGLLNEGRFAVPGADHLSTFHTPLYPLLIAANMWVFGEDAGPYAMIYQQIVLLFLTGLVVAGIVARTHPRLAFPALLLMIFNPNSFAAAHGTQTETVFTFLMAVSLFLFLRYTDSRRFRLLPVIGLVIAAAAYCRPAGLYLGLMIPFGAALYATAGCRLFGEGARQASRQFARALIVVVVAVVALAPWYARNHDVVGKYVFSTNLGLYLRDNVIYVYTKTTGETAQAMAAHFDERFDAWLVGESIKPRNRMNLGEESGTMVRFSLGELADQPLSSIARTAVQSVLFLYGTGGTGTLRDLWGLEAQGVHAIEHFEGDGSMFGSAWQFLQRISPGYAVLVFAGLAFAFILRVLGLAGLVAIARSPHWRDVLLYAGVLTFFSTLYLFLGQPRFRLPMEPVLVIIALWGWDALFGGREAVGRKRYPAGDRASPDS